MLNKFTEVCRVVSFYIRHPILLLLILESSHHSTRYASSSRTETTTQIWAAESWVASWNSRRNSKEQIPVNPWCKRCDLKELKMNYSKFCHGSVFLSVYILSQPSKQDHFAVPYFLFVNETTAMSVSPQMKDSTLLCWIMHNTSSLVST